MRSSAKRFFRKALQATHTQEPRVINVDKNADLPKAIDQMKAKEELSKCVELRQNKYLNNQALAGPQIPLRDWQNQEWDFTRLIQPAEH